ncbi:estradiol 17-beta-dehydrogenase 11 [Drosophila bipectinata]|uniref:estradiol 17-beta-dehydrogenase 11 n=1 Tax=Drosophila bipectinata TaxID=42026 RepID=UPI001C895391|nr:estradiol 17-beta-dehydrogenase 11 [Drosophila bipectinata]
MSEAVRDALVKLKAQIGVIGLAALTPLLVLAAILQKLFATIFCCQSPKSILGEVAVVTGGGHGLGRAICLELAHKGCNVAVVDINLSGAEATVKQIQDSYQVRAKAYKANVTSYKEIVELNTQVVRDLGPVTVLVNNAGVLLLRKPLNPDPADVQLMMDVNLTSHFWTKAVFLPKMKELRRGFIVTIASLAALFPLAYSSTYASSKSGAMAHMRALRLELALEKQKNIKVTTVFPTFLRTNDEVRELSNNIGVRSFYPLISGEEVAQRVVSGMLRGESEIHLPGLTCILYRLLLVLPADWQDLAVRVLGRRVFNSFREIQS